MRKTAYSILVGLIVFAEGCVNCYTRFPTTSATIQAPYQCTKEAAALSYIVMFPQIMADSGHKGIVWANMISIPLGCVCMCDVPLEAVLDTICIPYDMLLMFFL